MNDCNKDYNGIIENELGTHGLAGSSRAIRQGERIWELPGKDYEFKDIREYVVSILYALSVLT